MTTNHPITPPPPEVMRSWWSCIPDDMDLAAAGLAIATEAARWGADQELEACCRWLRAFKGACFSSSVEHQLRTARRPKPPTLAEEALTLLDDASTRLDAAHEYTIRRALERLQELENNG